MSNKCRSKSNVEVPAEAWMLLTHVQHMFEAAYSATAAKLRSTIASFRYSLSNSSEELNFRK